MRACLRVTTRVWCCPSPLRTGGLPGYAQVSLSLCFKLRCVVARKKSARPEGTPLDYSACSPDASRREPGFLVGGIPQGQLVLGSRLMSLRSPSKPLEGALELEGSLRRAGRGEPYARMGWEVVLRALVGRESRPISAQLVGVACGF